MTLAALGPLAPYVVVFCRVGMCLMLMPGYASPHVPVRVRLFLAIAVSLATTPLVAPLFNLETMTQSSAAMIQIVCAESLAGGVIGLLARLIFAAVQMGAGMITQLSGYSGLPTIGDGSGELAPEFGAIITAAVLTLLFVFDFHADMIKTLIESYLVLPLGAIADSAETLDRLCAAVAGSFRLAVRMAAPFVVAAVVINFAFGIVNKIAPQIPAIFVSAPFILFAAIWIYEQLGPELALVVAKEILTMWAGQ